MTTKQYLLPHNQLLGNLSIRPVPQTDGQSNIQEVEMKMAMKRPGTCKSSDDDTDEGLSMLEPRNNGKKNKKPRRARKQRYRPYYQLTGEERIKLEERELQRANRMKERRLAMGKPLAPYNTTQFIMKDHGIEVELDLGTSSGEDTQTNSTVWTKPQRGMVVRQRARDSSFSLDTDEEFFYSSPEDEEDFVSKEFSKDYDKGIIERLSALGKGDLITDYMIMEERVETLNKRMMEVNAREELKARNGEADYEFHKGEIPMSPETAEKIRIFQTEILKLKTDNVSLKRENSELKIQLNQIKSSTSSSSSSSESSSESDTDEEDVESDEGVNMSNKSIELSTSRIDDVGYESGQSGVISNSELLTNTSI